MNQVDRARECAKGYRSIGLCPLPSRSDKKSPAMKSYSEYYEGNRVPESVYDSWGAENIQLITGTKSPSFLKLLVVDCDGKESFETWNKMCEHHGFSAIGTWVCRTGGGGTHVYFSLPIFSGPVASGMIWGKWDCWGDDGNGKWDSHKEVRIQADNALVVAPPSIHVDTGSPYFFDDQANPNRIRIPVQAPKWLIDMPRLSAPRFQDETPKPAYVPKIIQSSGRFYTRDEVLAAVGDNKLAEAKSWGLRTRADEPNKSGWVSCWVPGREDPSRSSPSGSFHYLDGTLQDRKDCSTISFLDLGVVLGRYATWQDCRDDLGDKYIGLRTRTSPKRNYG